MDHQMINLDIAPGFFSEETDAGAAGRWKDGNLVRFKNALPQSMGGWQKQELSSSLLGVPRSNHDWVALDETKYVAVGTEKRLYVIDESFNVYNLTPIRDSGSLTDPFFTSTAGAYDPNSAGDASFVQVQDVAHGCQVGDIVTFDSFTSPVGGVTVNGDFEVITIVDTDNYVIQASSDATGTVAGGGGTGNYIYEITVGDAATGVSSGYGAGEYGDELYGKARTESTFVQELRTWSLDNWGEDLIASPRGGGIYVWDKSAGTGTRAQLIANAPDTALRVFVSPENRQLIALGAHNGTDDDPLFIAWCDNEDYTTWLPGTDNTAGDKRLDQGSEIITGLATRVGILVFSDKSVHVMQPVCGIEIYSFRQVGAGISIAGPAAATEAAGVVYFMGITNFYVYDGVLRVLPCDVWAHVFENFNRDQSFSVFCSHNKDFNEVWWFYPSAGQATNDKYVVFNYVEGVWYYGELERASFHDYSPFVERPFGFDNAGNFYIHETGNDADDVPMSTYIESGDLMLGDGDQLMHVSKMIPNFKRQTGPVEIELQGRKYPQKAVFVKGPYTVGTGKDEVGVRVRARQLALKVSQNSRGASFRMGNWRARMRPDGKR